MGLFYATTLVAEIEHQCVVGWFEEQQRQAYILPPQRGYIIVYDAQADSQEREAVADVTQKLSLACQSKALTIINQDDDYLLLCAYNKGISVPSTAAALSELFDKPKSLQRLTATLTTNMDAGEQHRLVAKLLGLPFRHTQIGFEELATSEQELGYRGNAFGRVVTRRLLQVADGDEQIRSFNLEREVRRLLRQHKPISAITLYRQRQGATLQEAQEYIRTLSSQQPKA